VEQFARLIHVVLPEATKYSFGPLTGCHRELSRALAGFRGGQDTRRRGAVVRIESAFVPLYREQLLFADLLGRMEALGFTLHGNMAQYDDPRSGCPLIADSFFINARFGDRVLG
jgi:hypothetical protein